MSKKEGFKREYSSVGCMVFALGTVLVWAPAISGAVALLEETGSTLNDPISIINFAVAMIVGLLCLVICHFWLPVFKCLCLECGSKKVSRFRESYVDEFSEKFVTTFRYECDVSSCGNIEEESLSRRSSVNREI